MTKLHNDINTSPESNPQAHHTVCVYTHRDGRELTITANALVLFTKEGEEEEKSPKIQPMTLSFSDPIIDESSCLKYYIDHGTFDSTRPSAYPVSDTEYYLTVGRDAKAILSFCTVGIDQDGKHIPLTEEREEKTHDVYFEYTHPKYTTFVPTGLPEEDSSSSSGETETPMEEETHLSTEMTELITGMETQIPEPGEPTEEETDLPTEMLETILEEPTEAPVDITEMTTQEEEDFCCGCDGCNCPG